MTKKPIGLEQTQEIIRLYTTKANDGTWVGAKTIARQFSISPQSVYNILTRAGIKTRDARESHAHGKACKPVVNSPPMDEPVPLCKCGCGQSVYWNQRKNRWNLFAKGHYQPKLNFHNREWLYNEYVVKQRMGKDIASEFGVSERTILHWLHKLDIPVRKNGESLIIGGKVKGAKNPSWKGGVTPERQRLYKTTEWKDLVKTVFKRDDYHCKRCGAAKVQGRKLHAHHIKSFAHHKGLRFDKDNLITLCDNCHVWVHSLENTEREFIG